ncbi:TIGR04283 family arsenosugar biosynthesis glycosyltransferase [Cellulophaga sp. HaHaR_3_176]|uniref:TIGR04283 family arsenosugar biosynthesis glycosyltransferase n=1 Tax=Cellulophaga sp. HaHaR_3_176 TaxID=1942464 RepID=UPI001C1F587A|nr:TIGR04283 family arsenosugar biosynthesis glycosyltransferase [Cellulophaga sp. HaHaR_3_176]QWX83168.1 TIGR04283 family arsenosugar biosynthesis glycosyltransferase [Cellulophaga sp. HaHaR_3_176]
MKSNNLKISIIIPVLNEEASIARILDYLISNSSSKSILEIIVIDGGSTDATAKIASKMGAIVLYSERGRAKQLNVGAKHAKGDILYFLHVDTFPPTNYDLQIIEAVKKGNNVGCFEMKFDSNSRFLNFFAWFTKVNHTLCRGGDQSLFITNTLFNETAGFDENYKVYEDNEFICRIYKVADFKILPFKIKTSARRYDERGKYILQYHFGIIHLKNYLGAGPEQLYEYYRKKIAS